MTKTWYKTTTPVNIGTGDYFKEVSSSESSLGYCYGPLRIAPPTSLLDASTESHSFLERQLLVWLCALPRDLLLTVICPLLALTKDRLDRLIPNRYLVITASWIQYSLSGNSIGLQQ